VVGCMNGLETYFVAASYAEHVKTVEAVRKCTLYQAT
jgi:hypothetical protein